MSWHYYRSVEIPPLDSRARSLPAVWRLEAPGPNGVVADVEALCVAVVEEYVERNAAPSQYVDRDLLLGFALGEAVVLHSKYDPAKRHGSGSFSGYLYDRLRFRLVDFVRSWYGRQGQHRLSSFEHDGDAGDARLGEPVAESAEDAALDRLATCGGLLTLGDRSEDGQDRGAGGNGDHGPGRGATAVLGRAGAAAASTGRGAPPTFVDCLACGWRSYVQAPNGMPGWHWPERCAACGEALKVAA